MGANYEKNLYCHLQETLEKVEVLTHQIASLEIEHKREIEALNARILKLEKENQTLREENQKLKDILNKNSGNSSKPPSVDGFVKIHNSREPSGKRPGGQEGHKGAEAKFYSNPTRVEDIKAEKCSCGGKIKYTGIYKRKQLVDIEFTTSVTEYREYEGICECCHCRAENHAPVKDDITYGNDLKSLSVMLSTEGMVSINRIKQMLCELSGGMLNLSEGTICKWNEDLARCVAPAIDTIKEKLLTAPVLHKDETGIRVNDSLHWLHVLANEEYTLYFADKKRGNDADKAMGILPAYGGVLVHDHLRGLYDFTCRHAECNAHILRYLKAAVENKKRKWAADMIVFLLETKKMTEDSGGQISDPNVLEQISRRYDVILKEGFTEFLNTEKSDYNGEDMKLLRRLREYKTEHLRFAAEKDVPFDNNQAERDLRMIKAKTKISGCFRAPDGGAIFAALKSYTSTLRKNARNIFLGIKSAFDLKPSFADQG